MKHQRWFQYTAIACLAFLVVFLLKLFSPQVALGHSPFTPNISNSPSPDIPISSVDSKPGKTLIAASYQDALKEAEKQFICFKSSKEYPISQFRRFSPSEIETRIVRRLASQLSECVEQNRRSIDFVDLNNLFRVIYTTRILQDSNTAVVIVGVGSPTQIPDRARFSEGLVDFFAANTDKINPSVTLSNNDINNRSFPLFKEPFNLGRLGKLVIESKGHINLPSNKLRLSGNETSINTSLDINHELEVDGKSESFNFFRLSFQGKASDFDKDLLSGRKKELASAELTFNGLLMKGIPLYFEARKEKLKKDLAIEIKTDSTKNQTTLSKKIGVPEYNKLEEIRRIEKELNDKLYELRTRQEQIKKEPSNSQIQNKLQASENELKNIMSDKIRLLESIYKIDFQCAPAFMKKVEFPIWGKTASTGSGNSGASASVGVRGDAVIDISQPTCSFSIVPPYNSKSKISTDVSVSSNGYFGVRTLAQATGSFNIKFVDKYGEYLFDINQVSQLGNDEKRYVSAVLEKTWEDVKNDQKIIAQLQEKIQREFVDKLLSSSSLADELINRVSSNVEELCKSYVNELGANGKLVCWAAKYPTRPDLAIAERIPEFEKRFSQLHPTTTVSQACKLGKELPSCPTIKTRIPPFVGPEVEVEQPDCAATIAPIKTACNLWNREKETWERLVGSEYNLYRNPNEIRKVAEQFVRKSILVPGKFSPNISKNLALKLLDLAWQAEGGLSNVNDKIDEVLQPAALLKNLNLSIKSSATAEFDSKARILETGPAFQLESTLIFPDGKPAMRVKGSFYKNGPRSSKEGRIGGLEPLNLNLEAALVASLGSKEILADRKDWDLSSPTIGKPILLSRQEQLISEEDVSLIP